MTISGTKEWSVASVNCVTGCSHDCRYCYARAMALRYHRIKRPEDWAMMRVRQREVSKPRRKAAGTVMFPTTHDITPDVLPACLEVIERLLQAGNRLLIVSKPHLECVEAICDRFDLFRGQVLLRFTIGAIDDLLLSYWEPGAPAWSQRLAALKHAYLRGWRTSVSAEPLLDSPDAGNLVRAVGPWVTDTIWIGKMNSIRARAAPGTSEAQIHRIEIGQRGKAVRAVYAELKSHPEIRWKESYKKVLGLELATEAGLDS